MPLLMGKKLEKKLSTGSLNAPRIVQHENAEGRKEK